MPKVTMIPATINPLTHLPSANVQKRRVAGYARVSTDSDEQFTSYEAQVDYYTKYIKANPEWEFVRVYADEGISAVSTKRRDGFREMIADALDGKIDLIVTKSVSRFARNTVDSLVTIRKLKEHGVECYFEKEGIYTFDGKGELLHVKPCAGGKPEHFRERHMGTAQELLGREGSSGVHPFPRI